MQPVLKFNVRNQNISRVDTFLPVRYSRNYLYAEFDFKTCDWSDWNEKTKTAIFSGTGLEPIPVILGETDTCLVPWEVLECTEFTVTVHAGDLVTVDSAKVKLYESGYRPGGVPEPTPDVYQQLINMLTDQVDGLSYTDNILSLMAGEKNIASVTITGGSGSGTDGREIELQNDGIYIQWRYSGEEYWNNLVDLLDLKGSDGYTPKKNIDYFDGINGKSAYEYAKEGGYTGTEEEFSQKLKKEIPDVDSILNEESENAIQNKAVAKAISSLSDEIDGLKRNGIGGSGGTTTTINQADLVKTVNYDNILGENKEDNYCCWTAGMCKYDKNIDKVVFMYNAKNGHINGTSRVYMRTIDCQNLEISDSTLVADQFNVNGLDYPAICYFFFIRNDGKYVALVKAGYPDNNDKGYKVYKFTSSDFGQTWTNEETDIVEQASRMGETFYNCFNPVRLSNGRIIGTAPCNKQYAIWSDNDGDTWTLGTNTMYYNEGQIIELGTAGHLVSINRKNVNTYGTAIPAHLSYSTDYGETWTDYGASNSIKDMTANNACYVIDEDGIVNLFVASRYTGGGQTSIMYKQSGTLEQLANDELDDPVVAFYGNAIHGQDFGYPACCKDKYGQIYLVYYDGDADVSDFSTIKLTMASRQNIYNPINDNVAGKTNTYSAEMVEKLLKQQYNILIAKINNIIIESGADIEDELNGSYPVTDGLIHWFDVDDIVDTTWADKMGDMSLAPTNYDTDTKIATFSSTVTLGKAADIGTSGDVAIEMVIYNESRPIVHSQFGTFDADLVVEGKAMYVLSEQYAYNDWNANTHQFIGKLLHVILNADYTNGVAEVYVNGILRGSVSAELNEDATRTWYLCDGGGDAGNIRIYDKPLTAEEVINNYNYEKSLYIFNKIAT